MITVTNVTKSYKEKLILSDISFTLGRGQKAVLVGSNGAGKTTLLKILAGIEKPDTGIIKFAKGVSLGYLSQDTSVIGSSIVEYLKTVTGLLEIEKGMDKLIDTLNVAKSLEKYNILQNRYEELGGYTFEFRMEAVLEGLGLQSIKTDTLLSILSGGQKRKVGLAGVLLKNANLLLLDEPTNDLDLPALIWLEEFLRSSDITCLIVSHDRRFIDGVVHKVFEIDTQSKTLTASNGSYTEYLSRKEKERLRMAKDYKGQQDKIKRLTQEAEKIKVRAIKGASGSGKDNDKFLRGFKRDKSSKSASVARALYKRIDLMDKVEKPIEKRGMKVNVTTEKPKGMTSVTLKGVVVKYSDDFQIGPISCLINYGDRVGIVGSNGIGKSTILKVIHGLVEPFSGNVDIGSQIVIGNLMQEHENLPRNCSVLNFVIKQSGLQEFAAYSLLVKYGFNPTQVKTLISKLSPGERTRLSFALFEVRSINMLLLDEPTNHLDIEALSALEELLENFKGTIIVVSHDRAFLKKIALTDTYLLTKKELKVLKDFQDYVKMSEKRAMKLLRKLGN